MHDGLYRFHLHAGAHKLQAATGGALHVGQKALDRAAPVSRASGAAGVPTAR